MEKKFVFSSNEEGEMVYFQSFKNYKRVKKTREVFFPKGHKSEKGTTN